LVTILNRRDGNHHTNSKDMSFYIFYFKNIKIHSKTTPEINLFFSQIIFFPLLYLSFNNHLLVNFKDFFFKFYCCFNFFSWKKLLKKTSFGDKPHIDRQSNNPVLRPGLVTMLSWVPRSNISPTRIKTGPSHGRVKTTAAHIINLANWKQEHAK